MMKDAAYEPSQKEEQRRLRKEEKKKAKEERKKKAKEASKKKLVKKKLTKAERRAAKNPVCPRRDHKFQYYAEIAENTLKILEQGYYENEYENTILIAQQQELAVAKTILYTPKQQQYVSKNLQEEERDKDTSIDDEEDNGETTSKEKTEGDNYKNKNDDDNRETIFEVNDLTTLDAARKLTCKQGDNASILCLNFASGKNAGGGFLRGSQAQEESIACASGLYPCLIQDSVQDYYKSNQVARAPFYTDHMIYSQNVPVFRNEDGSLMEEPMLVSFLTALAVNVREAHKKGGEGKTKNLTVEATMRRQIAKILQIAKAHGHDCLVLGAWGCSVFGNDPKDVACWFLLELQAFKFWKVVFAIYSTFDKQYIQAFLWEFKRCGLEDFETEEEEE